MAVRGPTGQQKLFVDNLLETKKKEPDTGRCGRWVQS